jgi:hypothetical protein
MSPTAAAEGRTPAGQRPVTASDCRRWLQQHHEGRLGYLSGRGPRSVVVSYALADDHILMRVPDYNDIAQYAPGSQVTLAVDGLVEPASPSRSEVEEVSVTGIAAQADEPPSPVDTGRLDESWPSGIKTSVVSLPLTQISGVQRRAAHRPYPDSFDPEGERP